MEYGLTPGQLGEKLVESLTHRKASMVRCAEEWERKAREQRQHLTCLDGSIAKWSSDEGRNQLGMVLVKLGELGVTNISGVTGSYWNCHADCMVKGKKGNISFRATPSTLTVHVREEHKWGRLIDITVRKNINVHDHRLDRALEG